jgi:hypothetical protein
VTLGGEYIPGKRDEITPVSIGQKQGHGCIDIAV